jgi:adenylosuccinate synthase
MPKRIVVLSGRVGVGKTTLCNGLAQMFDLVPVKTNELIEKRAGDIERERGAMQLFGESLDRRTKGQWVAEDVSRISQSVSDDAIIIIDSVRISRQVDAIRASFGAMSLHIHLEASINELARRYEQDKKRAAKYREFKKYSDLWGSKTEANVDSLRDIADVVINTELSTPADVIVRAAARIGLYPRESNQLVDVAVGGEYGSEGKGHICHYLAREYDLLVRVGGPNAGHTVFEFPKPYKHYQLPCGTRNTNADLMIGPGAVLNVEKLLIEIRDCGVGCERLSIDPQAMIIEQRDRIREGKTIVGSIGSTGQGVGAATARKVMRGADGKVRLAKDVRELHPYIRESRSIFEKAFRLGKKVFLEGTQGTGLSLHHGSYPHVTSRETSVAGCLSDAGISPSSVRKTIIVCRTYPIRVEDPKNSTSGPMSREISWSTISRRSGIPLRELEERERTTTTHRRRRVSEFDWDLFRKAVSLNAPTDVALTFVDYFTITNRSARRFEQLSSETIRFIEELERVACAPVSLISTRFEERSIIDRRAW